MLSLFIFIEYVTVTTDSRWTIFVHLKMTLQVEIQFSYLLTNEMVKYIILII